jgi:hypothetical protein
MKVYISGKISGLEYYQAQEKFKLTADALKLLGCEPVNPFDNGLTENDPWTKHMAIDIEMLMQCEAIALLSNWKDSKGARIEHYIAKEMGLLVVHVAIKGDTLLITNNEKRTKKIKAY